jgi:xanthine dehydrogenase YagR molybdenum-binding subunit
MIPKIGAPLDRVDGRDKVTGTARYAAENNLENVAHAVLIGSTIAAGTIRSIDTTKAKGAPGVIGVFSHLNTTKLTLEPPAGGGGGSAFREPRAVPFAGARVHYLGQPVAVVVAESLEEAMHAADLIRVAYAKKTARTSLQAHRKDARDTARSAFEKGSADAAFAAAALKIDQVYTTPYEHHTPMELHSIVAAWNGDKLTLHDSSQNIFSVRQTLARAFAIPQENVRVLSPFVGGAFGSKGGMWPHVLIGAMAARAVKRPVKLAVTRRQYFFTCGHRPQTSQRVALGATPDGKLVSIIHEGVSQGNAISDYAERFTRPTRVIYAAPNIRAVNPVVQLDVSTPTFMRAPGEAPGMFAIESAMDELAYAAGLDPLQLRLINHADSDPAEGKPWSSKSLKECYARAAERFGWSRRAPQPRSMRDGPLFIGMGMASATYPAHRSPASAKASMKNDGTMVVQCGSHEMGMGTATVMGQLAATIIGLPPERVRFEYGDTALPRAPLSAGSQTAASVGSAVHGVASNLKRKLIEIAIADERSPLHDANPDEVIAADGRLSLRNDPARGESYSAIVSRQYLSSVDTTFDATPDEAEEKHATHAFGAHFAEVSVDPDLAIVRLRRIVSAFAGGRILNEKTALGQYVGGIVWGIGMALLEKTYFDEKLGSYTSVNLGEYLLPVNADVRDIDVILVEEDDPYVNPIGVKGIGEIGIVGVPAAIANAVFHATGQRVRDLPITIDKLLG